MKKTKSILDFNLNFFRKGTFLTFTTLLFVTFLFFPPFLSITWGATEYTITYQIPAGASHPLTPQTYVNSSLAVPIPDPYNPRYEFIGWNVKYSNYTHLLIGTPNEVRGSYSIPAGSGHNVILTAIFSESPFSFSIDYELNGGTQNPLNPSKYFGDLQEFPIPVYEPVKAGYDFLGWTVVFTEPTISDVTTPTKAFSIADGTIGNIKFTAHWSSAVDYTITYDVNGGNPHSGPNSYNVENLPRDIGTPSRSGHDFLRWLISFTNGSSTYMYNTVISVNTTGAITLKAMWNPHGSPTTYPIDYILNNGVNALGNPTSYSLADTFPIVIQNPIRTGYEFLGWTVEYTDGTPNLVTPIKPYGIPIGTTGTIRLSAQWRQITDNPNTYTVTYTDNGATGGNAPIDSKFYFYNDDVIVLGQGSLTRTGHIFIGWSLSPAANIPDYIEDLTFKIQDNTLLFAVWRLVDTPQPPAGPFTVTYRPGAHGTFTEQITANLYYGDATPTAPVVTGENGWKFTVWSPIPVATVTGNTVYVAQWEQEQTVTATPTVTPVSTPSFTATPVPSSIVPTPREDTPVNVDKPNQNNWSFVNLLLSLIGVLVAVVFTVWRLALNKDKTRKTSGNGFLQRWTIWLAVAVVISIVNILVFLATEDLSVPFGWLANKWTILNTVILVIEIISITLCIKATKHGNK